MANVGEAQITRLTRERLAAIKKFLPVRDSFRDNLQARQQQRLDFTADTEQLFKPITTATEKVVTATERVGTEVAKVGTETEKIAKRTKQVKKSLKTLPVDIVAAQPKQVEVQPEPDEQLAPVEQLARPKEGRIYRPDEIFTPTTMGEIENISTNDELARYAVNTFDKRKIYAKPGFDRYIGIYQWYKKVYLAKHGGLITSRRDPNFAAYEDTVIEIKSGLPRYEELLPEQIDVKAEADLMQDIPKKGTGYHGGEIQRISNIPCSRSILDDISRLEVLIGGKRAGNKSPEIINEASEICQRLFQGHVMDIGLYRSFIDELTDDYYSD